MKITKKIAEYIYCQNNIQTETKKIAIDCFIDTFGCMILGSREKTAKKVIRCIKENSVGKEAAIYCQNPFTAEMNYAIFANGIFSHSCDFDDMTTAGCGHPSIPIFPLILALGEKKHKSGEEMIVAYIKGMEVSLRLGSISARKKFNSGWNPTTVIGIFGAVTAASILMGLDEKQTEHAIALAACEAGGTRGNYGTEGKNISVGSLGVKAVACACLAKNGIEASEDGLDGENGYLACFTEDIDVKDILQAFEIHDSFLIKPGVIQKPYPTCRSNHNAIDVGIWLHSVFGKKIDEIEKIYCFVDKPSINLDLYYDPQTPEEAKFSMAYCLALALLYGEIKTELFLSDGLIDEKARAFLKKITIFLKEDWEEKGHFINSIKVFLKDGTVEHYIGHYGKGHPKKPLREDEKYVKFTNCLKYSVREDMTLEIYERLKKLMDCDDYCSIRNLTMKGLER